jgi:hypothetical protein
MDVDDILRSEAFGLISTFSPETEQKLNRLSILQSKATPLNSEESFEIKQLSLFVKDFNPYGIEKFTPSLEKKVAALAAKISK